MLDLIIKFKYNIYVKFKKAFISGGSMIRQIIFDDQITLWWEYKDFKNINSYECLLNDEKYATVNSTHITFRGLKSDTEYKINIIADNGTTVFDGTLRTKKAKRRIDITKEPYNAIGDGVTLNTAAIQKAFDDCGENDCVYIPSGVFLSGALRMHSHFDLYIEKDATLKGSEKREDYLPKIKSRFEGLEFMCYSSLLNAGELDSEGGANCFDILIRGEGKIIGGGNPLRQEILDFENESLKEYIASLGESIKEFENTNTIAGRRRPRLINISNCKDFVICGIEYGNSPSWNLHMTYSQDLTVYNCKAVSHGISNGDGIDPDSVENCAIFGCEFDTSDDCIAIKSGRNPEGNVVNRKTKDVYIFDCVCAGHSVCVGSEMSGGVENVYIWDCDLTRATCGIQLKFTKKRGGYIKNCYFYRCTSSRITIWSCLYNDDGKAAPTISELSGFYFEDFILTGIVDEFAFKYKYIMIRGIDKENPVRNVYLKNITLKEVDMEGEAIVIENAENVVFDKIVK